VLIPLYPGSSRPVIPACRSIPVLYLPSTVALGAVPVRVKVSASRQRLEPDRFPLEFLRSNDRWFPRPRLVLDLLEIFTL